MVNRVRVKPLVRLRYGNVSYLGAFAWWECDLCDLPPRGFWPWDRALYLAQQHYREVHVPGLQRLEAALRALPDEPPQCGAHTTGIGNEPIGPCVLPEGHQLKDDKHEAASGTTWELRVPPAVEPQAPQVVIIEDYPAPQIPWRWLLLTLGVALVVAAAVLILADVVPWGLGVLPW